MAAPADITTLDLSGQWSLVRRYFSSTRSLLKPSLDSPLSAGRASHVSGLLLKKAVVMGARHGVEVFAACVEHHNAFRESASWQGALASAMNVT